MNRNYLRAIPREWRNLSRVFAALGDEHRQRILLTFEPGERLNVGSIVEVSTLSRTTVSHHLRVLREAGRAAVGEDRQGGLVLARQGVRRLRAGRRARLPEGEGVNRRRFLGAAAVAAAAVRAHRLPLQPRAGPLQRVPGAGRAPRACASRLVRAAWEGLDPARVWDCHAHLFGNGRTGSGIYLNPGFDRPSTLAGQVRRAMFFNAACGGEDEDRLDRGGGRAHRAPRRRAARRAPR